MHLKAKINAYSFDITRMKRLVYTTSMHFHMKTIQTLPCMKNMQNEITFNALQNLRCMST